MTDRHVLLLDDLRSGLDQLLVRLVAHKLLEIGYQNLRLNQQVLRQTAAKVDPKRPPREILHDLEKDHPPADQLLQTFRDVLGGLRSFIVQHKIVTYFGTVTTQIPRRYLDRR